MQAFTEVVPASLGSIVPILSASKEIEDECPRVAYLCRFYALERAHRLDPTSSGFGVRQFKTAMLEQLKTEQETTLASHVQRSDKREIEIFCQRYYENHIKALDEQGHATDRVQVAQAYHTAGVLSEVLCYINKVGIAALLGELAPSLGSITPILHMADEIEHESPRVACLCRFYAFEKAHRMDPTSSAPGVSRFKQDLLQILETEFKTTLASRVAKTDACEILSFYQQYYDNHVKPLKQQGEHDRAQLHKAKEKSGVLFKVLCCVDDSLAVEKVDPKVFAAA